MVEGLVTYMKKKHVNLSDYITEEGITIPIEDVETYLCDMFDGEIPKYEVQFVMNPTLLRRIKRAIIKAFNRWCRK